LGAIGLALVLSFDDPWSRGSWSNYWEHVDSWLAGLQLATASIFPVAAIALWVRSWTRRAWSEVMIGAVPVLAVVGWALATQDLEVVSAVMFNLYLFALGVGTLVIGMRGRRLGTVNAGMVVLSAVILCRFFDADFSFLAKGIAFIVVGIGFLATNLVLLRWKGVKA